MTVPRRPITLRRWHAAVLLAVLMAAIIWPYFQVSAESHERVKDRVAQVALLCQAINDNRRVGTEAINQNRAAIRGLVERAVMAGPQPPTAGGLRFLDDTRRSLPSLPFTPVDCKTLVSRKPPPKTVPQAKELRT